MNICISDREYLDLLNNYQLLKEHCTMEQVSYSVIDTEDMFHFDIQTYS
jgi:hypothetical protein